MEQAAWELEFAAVPFSITRAWGQRLFFLSFKWRIQLDIASFSSFLVSSLKAAFFGMHHACS